MAGYRSIFEDKLVTIWSAPNYNYRCGNDAAILQFDESLQPNFVKFVQAPEEARIEFSKGKKANAPEYFL